MVERTQKTFTLSSLADYLDLDLFYDNALSSKNCSLDGHCSKKKNNAGNFSDLLTIYNLSTYIVTAFIQLLTTTWPLRS